MKKLFAIAMALLLVFSLGACTSEPETETKYYLTEQIMEFADGSIQKQVYTYDDQWRQLTQVMYEGDAETFRAEYIYGEGSTTVVQTQNGVEQTVEMRNTRNEQDQIVRTEMYQNGELYTVTELEYDADGNRSRQTQTTASELMSMESVITFRPDGQILSQKSTTQYAEGTGMPTEPMESGADYTYDGDGNQIKCVNYYTANGNPATTEMVSEYNADGKVSKETTTDYDSEGNVTRTYYTEYTYDGNTQTSQTIQGGEMVSKNVTTYDDAGNILSSEMHNPYSDQITRFSYTWTAVEMPVK